MRTLQELKMFQEHLIRNATKSELEVKKLIAELGFKISFQYIIEPFIVDFCLTNKKKIIELDGAKFHNKIKDASRDLYLRNSGYSILRIPSQNIFKYKQRTKKQIEEFLLSK